jgi:hypothetical protein
MTREQKLERCLGFFASVIKSGEPWTETCEWEFREALEPACGTCNDTGWVKIAEDDNDPCDDCEAGERASAAPTTKDEEAP